MGNSMSDAFENEKAQAEVLEKLQALRKTMTEKIIATSDELQNQAKMDGNLPILALVDKVEKYHVNVKTVPDKNIEGAMKDFLSGKFLSGVVGLINVGLNAFLGNASAGESQMTDYHIIFANNSLLRLDYMIYRYNFKSQGISDKYQNGFCYYFQVGVLDLSKVNPEILLYELTKALLGGSNDENESDLDQKLTELQEDLQNLAKYAKSLYSTIRDLKDASKNEESQGEPGQQERTMAVMEELVNSEEEEKEDH